MAAGRGGAVEVRAVTFPEGAIDHKNSGASSTSVSSSRALEPEGARHLVSRIVEPIGQAIVGRADQMVGDDQVQDDGCDDVEHHHDQRGDPSDAHRMLSVPVGVFTSRPFRYPVPRTVSIRALLPPNLARTLPTWTSMVFDPTASASSSQTWVAMLAASGRSGTGAGGARPTTTRLPSESATLPGNRDLSGGRIEAEGSHTQAPVPRRAVGGAAGRGRGQSAR